MRLITGWVCHARATWVQANGVIPPGHDVHHWDEDTFNDSLDNLQAMTKSQHKKLHNRCVEEVAVA